MAMQKLMALEDWRRERFIKPPARNTVLGWIAKGDIPYKRIGGRLFIEVEKELQSTNDGLVDKVLDG